MKERSSHAAEPSSETLLSGCPLFSTSLEINRFASDWSHCDQLSNFLAKTATVERADPFYCANLLSTILNEVFESAFLYHRQEGELEISIRSLEETTVLETRVPVDEATARFFQNIATNLRERDPLELYQEHLLSPVQDDHSIGFYELVSIYDAAIQMTVQETSVHIVLSVQIDDFPQAVAA